MMIKADTLMWEELQLFVNNGEIEVVSVFQECEVRTCSRGGSFWTENSYRYRILYKEK